MSFRDDLEKALVDYEADTAYHFWPGDLARYIGEEPEGDHTVKLIAGEVLGQTRWTTIHLAVYQRNDEHGIPEYLGVEYEKGATEYQGLDWGDQNIAVVDVEPELRQVWTVKR